MTKPDPEEAPLKDTAEPSAPKPVEDAAASEAQSSVASRRRQKPTARRTSNRAQRKAARKARQEERERTWQAQSQMKSAAREVARERRRTQREARKSDRAETRAKLKEKALDKTPKRFKNPSDVQVRFRTGFVYIALTVLSIFLGNIATVIMLMAVAGICVGEFYYMLRLDAKLPNEALGIIATVLYPPAVYLYSLTGAMIVTVGLVIALLIWYVFFMRSRIYDVGVSFFGAAYTGLLISGIVIIRCSLDYLWGGIFTLMLFMSVWGNDVFAYLVGSKFGRHKLAPRTSPKKSWEGFLAGIAFSMIMWVGMSFIPGVTMSIIQALVFGAICGVMEVLGDLAESRIKRNSGVKDSGTIMPGHGGLLDRCDSLFLASVTAAILLVWGGCIPYQLF